MSTALPEATPAPTPAPPAGPAPTPAGTIAGQPASSAPAAPVPAPPTPQAPTPGAPATPPAPAAPTTPPAVDISTLAPEVQKLIGDLRQEAGKARTTAKENAAAEATQKIVRDLAKAAGITLPGDEPDPAKLTEQLTAANAQRQQAALELAVFRTASTGGADPALLLDSRSFLAKVGMLDASADDFGTQVGELIKTEVASNPRLKAGQVPGASGVEISGGSGEAGQITEEQLKTMTPEAIVDAQNKGLLRTLLGG